MPPTFEPQPLSPTQWLARAKVFHLTEGAPFPVKLVAHGSKGWMIELKSDTVLGKDGEQHYLMNASERTKAFYQLNCWADKEEAYAFWCEWHENHPNFL